MSIQLEECTPDDLLLKTLRVRWDDCCVGGEFTSQVVGVNMDEGYPSAIHFDNGVVLEGSMFGYKVEEVNA